MARLGLALIVLGLASLGYGVLWQLGLAPGSHLVLPAPVALSTPARFLAATPTPPAALGPTALQKPAAFGPTALPKPAAPAPMLLAPADANDRRLAAVTPPPGFAVRLAIPSIKLQTQVKQAGVVTDASGKPTWQTLPFVAVHYGTLTGLIGAPGNAVLAGHVVTLSEGNVFRFLYLLELDDEVLVWDDSEHEHTYRVVEVELVPPSDTSVMAPTPDETLTLITCGGTFDPIQREFSDRLVVTAKPL